MRDFITDSPAQDVQFSTEQADVDFKVFGVLVDVDYSTAGGFGTVLDSINAED